MKSILLAIATAISYSSVAGNKNVIPTITATMSAGYPILKCYTSTGIPCTGTVITGGANGIGRGTVELFVKEGAKVVIAEVTQSP